MEVQFPPDVQAELDRLADLTGRPSEDFVRDAVSGYFAELAEVRAMLDRRYDEMKNGTVTPISREDMIAHFREKSPTFGS